MLKSNPIVLTYKGYSIRKDHLTAEQATSLRKELTVAPKVAGRYTKPPDPFTVYQESASRYYIPRAWGTEKYGKAPVSLIADGDPLREDLKFIGKPYDYQQAIVQQFIDADANGLICVPCGRGKTFMAIQIAARLGHRFLIVVDKEFLLQQWSGELNALMPGIRIGIIQEGIKQTSTETKVIKHTLDDLKKMAKTAGLKVGGNKDELLNRLREADIKVETTETITYDCCIAMIQTLVARDFADTDFNGFGLTIFDECHHLGAAHFSRALLKVQTKHMLGLSATPVRDDGLTKVFEWFLGKPVYWEKTREADPDVIVKKVMFKSDDPEYAEVPVDFRGEPVLARLLTKIVEYEPRNLRIDELLAELVADPKRKILVLSERKAHLERIERGLPKGTRVGYYIGGMKEEVREEGARSAQVLLGTYAMASEAMNIKTLNTMIMVSPRKKIEQSTGRILRTRKEDRDVVPLIIDIVDAHDVYEGQWLKRRAYYKKCAYKIDGEKKKTSAKEVSLPEGPQGAEAGAEVPKGCMIVD